MAKIHQFADNLYVFHCPGCACGHQVAVNGNRMENGSGWQWNGSVDTPTFNPSILVRSKEMTAAGELQYERWMRDEISCPEHFESRDVVCHSFVRDGKIMFLADCTHKLAGQTVEIPEWDDD